MQAASTCKPKMISKAGLRAATLRLTHSQISFCRISGTHASVYCLTTWWAWDWVIVFPDWHVWQADEQAAPAEPADSSEKKDLRSSYSLNCNLWFSLSQFEHLRYQEWRLQSHSRLKDGGSLSSSSFHCILVLSVAIVAVLVIVVPVLALVLVFLLCLLFLFSLLLWLLLLLLVLFVLLLLFAFLLFLFPLWLWLWACFSYFLSWSVIGFRADLHNIALCTDSTYTRLWDYKYKRLWSRNEREWTVNESLSISPCRLSLVQVFMLLRVMRLHDLIIHWVRMSWLIYVSMFLVEPNSCNAAQYIYVYIWSAHIYALCKDSNSMTKDCFYLGHAVNG